MKKVRFYESILFIIIIFIISKIILNKYNYNYISYVYIYFYYFVNILLLIGTSIIMNRMIKEKDKNFIIFSFVFLYICIIVFVQITCCFFNIPPKEIVSEDNKEVIRKEGFLINYSEKHYEYVNPFIRKNNVIYEEK